MRACITVVIISLIIVYAYRLGYNQAANNANNNQPVVSANAEPAPVDNSPNVDTPASSPTANSAATGDSTVTHTVQDGETLFLIGLKYDVLWTTIATANNITENTPLKAGTKLIIPLNKDGSVTKNETLNVSDEESKQTQLAVDHGDQGWRKDLLEVVRRTMPVDYHLINDDPLAVTARDNSAGTATVEVQHDSQKFIVELVQPQTKGDSGVWYISKISTQ